MAQVWLIRHGQSEANAGMRSSNAAQIPLTALGRMQAEAVARRFIEAPARIIHSPYARAVQTSEPTQARFAAAPVECWPVQEFTYLSPARCHDTTSAERLPMVQAYWARSDPDLADGEGVESFRAFIARVDTALERLRAGEGLTAVFTHGQFLQACIWRLGAPAKQVDGTLMAAFRALMLQMPVPNAAVLELQLDANGARVGALATDHLSNLPTTY
jgi:broad specificity phosphatase PhoE